MNGAGGIIKTTENTAKKGMELIHTIKKAVK